MPTTIDFTPLTAPLPAGQSPLMVPIPRVVSRPRVLTGLALAFLGFITAFGAFGGSVGVMRNASDGLTSPANVIAPLAIGIIAVIVVVIGVSMLRQASRGAQRESMSPRLPAFATANGLLYSDASPNPRYPGSILR